MVTPISELARSDAHMQPLGTATVQNTSSPSSVNIPATFVSCKDSFISNNSSHEPTFEQKQAIADLQSHQNADIIAWHTLLQSVEPDLRHKDSAGGLVTQEIHALLALRDCARESLLRWLEPSSQLCPRNTGLSSSRFAAAALSRQTRRPATRNDSSSGHLSSVSSAKANLPHTRNKTHSTFSATHNRVDAGQTFPRTDTYIAGALVKQKRPDHAYWCTVCDDHSYQDIDGWRKHEREHEINYVCMLCGLFETTKDGRICVLCGALDQEDSHALVHNVAPCLNAVDHPSFKRKYDMVKHLKGVHGITNGGPIADTWRFQATKKAWSCGFCIQLFPSLEKRLKHISTQHFGRGQSISDWDFTNVIQGLLLQPQIREAWERLLNLLDPFSLSKISWMKLRSQDIQHKLEQGLTVEDPPQALAQAAYDNAEHDWSPAQHDEMAYARSSNAIPIQRNSKGLSPPSRHHAAASREGSVQCQAYSSPQQQAPEVSRILPASEPQSVHGAAVFDSSPAQLPALDYSPGLEPVASDTDDKISPQPATPYSDNVYLADPLVYYPWDRFNMTPNLGPIDGTTFHHPDLGIVNWSTNPYNDVDAGGSSLKRPRSPASPPALNLRRKMTTEDKHRKRMCRTRIEERETPPRGLAIQCAQGELDDDEDTTGGNAGDAINE